MVKEATTNRASHRKHTIVLPITEEHYAQIIDDPQRVRSEWLEPLYAESPELFPPGFDEYYEMAGHYTPKRRSLKIRRIALRDGTKYQLCPAYDGRRNRRRGGRLAPAEMGRSLLDARATVRSKRFFLVSLGNQHRSEQYCRHDGQDCSRARTSSCR